jgi:tape measure domain-containing protein
MGSQANLLARISADATPFTRAIGEVNTALDKAFQKAGASTRGFQALGASLSSFGSTLTLGVTAPVVAFGAAAVQAATKIDSLKRGLTTVTGSAAATEVEFRKLRETAKLPGIDFEQAVRGSIRLQTLGVSADRAREVMGNFANALAAAGGTKADFGEVVRQLSQLSSQSKVTKENLDPIIDRIPAVAAILKDKFGPAALGEPAKVFEALGISGKQLADILSDELGNRVPKITGSAQTAFDSFSEAVNETAGRIGDKFLPAVTDTLPELEKFVIGVGDAVDAFRDLPPLIQDTAIALGGLALAAGPILKVAGWVVQFGTAIRGAAAALSLLTPQTAALGAAVAYLVSIGPKIVRFFKNMADELDPLNDKSNDFVRTIAGQFPQMEKSIRSLNSAIGGLNGAPSTFQILSDTTGKWRSKLTELGKDGPPALDGVKDALERFRVETVSSYAEDFKTAVLKERLSLLTSDYSKRLSDGVSALVRYGSAAGAAAAAMRELRIAEEPPELRDTTITDVRRLPTPNVPGLPSGAVLDGSDAARSSKRNLEMIRQTAKGAQDSWKNARTQISRQVSTITTDFSRAVVNIIRGTESIGEAMTKVGRAAVDGLLRTGIEFAVNEGIKLLGKLLNSMGGVASKIGGILGGTGGGGTSGGGAQGGVGSAVSAASGGILGMVTSIGSLVSGVIGNFQMAGMNKTLDLIEKEVRYSQIHLLYILEKLNQHLPGLDDINQRLIEFRQVGIKIEGGGAGLTVNITVQGSLVGGPNVAAELSALVVRNLKLQGV